MEIFKVWFLIILIFSNVVDALTDGLIDKDGKRRHGEVSAIVSMLLLVVVYDHYGLTGYSTNLILGWVFFRYAVFNTLYNGVRKLKVEFIGTTDWNDKLINYVLKLVNLHGKTNFVIRRMVIMGSYALSALFGVYFVNEEFPPVTEAIVNVVYWILDLFHL